VIDLIVLKKHKTSVDSIMFVYGYQEIGNNWKRRSLW